jgi:hypothetical protein
MSNTASGQAGDILHERGDVIRNFCRITNLLACQTRSVILQLSYECIMNEIFTFPISYASVEDSAKSSGPY